jgi:hypothetical protein
LLDALADRGEVGVRSIKGIGDGKKLAYGAADDHRHPERLGLVEAEADILVGEAGGEAEIEGPGQDGAREFVLVALLRPLLTLMTSIMVLASRPALAPITIASEEMASAQAATG